MNGKDGRLIEGFSIAIGDEETKETQAIQLQIYYISL
jgi:hypothetical protein